MGFGFKVGKSKSGLMYHSSSVRCADSCIIFISDYHHFSSVGFLNPSATLYLFSVPHLCNLKQKQKNHKIL